MDPINPADVSRALSPEQLRRGASGIAYRTEQLVYVTMVTDFMAGARSGVALRNARIESALVHGRALAYFLTSAKHDSRNLHVSHYSKSAWSEGSSRITYVAEKVIKAASHHLAHASIGDEEWEPHPGDWPLNEMALIFSHGLAEFVEALNKAFPKRAELFGPTPRVDYQMIASSGTQPTEVSDHPIVGDLTRSLQTYLRR